MNKELINKLKEFLNSNDKLLDKKFKNDWPYKKSFINEQFLEKFKFKYRYDEDMYDETFKLYYDDVEIYGDSHCSCGGFEFWEYDWTIRDFINKGLGIE